MVTSNNTNETVRRVKRTALQALAGGVLVGIPAALLAGRDALLVAILTALSTVVASYARNSLEDHGVVKDRR